jgi:hypothetical protein
MFLTNRILLCYTKTGGNVKTDLLESRKYNADSMIIFVKQDKANENLLTALSPYLLTNENDLSVFRVENRAARKIEEYLGLKHGTLSEE